MSTFDTEKKKLQYLATPKTKLKEENKTSHEVKQLISERCRNDGNHKFRKMVDMTSSLHEKNFYSENMPKSTNQDRQTDTFQIIAESGYDKLGSHEIKYLFKKKG